MILLLISAELRPELCRYLGEVIQDKLKRAAEAQLKGKSPKSVAKLKTDAAKIDEFVRAWGNMVYDQNIPQAQIRDFLANQIKQMNKTHPVKQALTTRGGDVEDLFRHWAHVEPPSPQAAKGVLDAFWTRLKYRGQEAKLNAVLETAQFAGSIASDAVANFNYSFQDWLDQGYSVKEAANLAWAYTIDRTPTDITAELLAEADIGPRWLNFLAQLGVRATLLIPDLDQSGQVRPDVYEAEPIPAPSVAANRGGYILNQPHKSNNVILGGY